VITIIFNYTLTNTIAHYPHIMQPSTWA